MTEIGEAHVFRANVVRDDDSDDIHFIVLADRPVEHTLGIFNHYRIEHWRAETEAIVLYEESDASQFKAEHQFAMKLDGIELLRNTDYNAWMRPPPTSSDSEPGPIQKPEVRHVAVSILHLETKEEKESEKTQTVMPIYAGSRKDVEAKWAEIVSATKKYQHGEMYDFKGNFVSWPNSRYLINFFGFDANNSNTFIRWLVHSTSLKMKELSGLHPGYYEPKPLPREDYYGNPWRRGEKPPKRPTP